MDQTNRKKDFFDFDWLFNLTENFEVFLGELDGDKYYLFNNDSGIRLKIDYSFDKQFISSNQTTIKSEINRVMSDNNTAEGLRKQIDDLYRKINGIE